MFKPMLAGSLPEDLADFNSLKFPVLASPKLDGVRATIQDGVVLSRNLKPIPNKYVQGLFGRVYFDGLDGELTVGDPTSPTVFRTTSSAVMSEDGEPDVTYRVFDKYGSAGFYERLTTAKNVLSVHVTDAEPVPHELLHTPAELLTVEERFLSLGYEGVMLRDPTGRYKEGRSTLREGLLLKLKRFRDSEAAILGYEERMHNANEKTLESAGKAKRSHHKAGLVPTGTLGALIVRDIHTQVEFNIGTGFTDADRDDIWAHRDEYKASKIVKYKYFPSGGKDKPRFPSFQGFRDMGDMD